MAPSDIAFIIPAKSFFGGKAFDAISNLESLYDKIKNEDSRAELDDLILELSELIKGISNPDDSDENVIQNG